MVPGSCEKLNTNFLCNPTKDYNLACDENFDAIPDSVVVLMHSLISLKGSSM